MNKTAQKIVKQEFLGFKDVISNSHRSASGAQRSLEQLWKSRLV